jgi:WhiB family transcriptional regulator, redox-sensing transcriptional regulator
LSKCFDLSLEWTYALNVPIIEASQNGTEPEILATTVARVVQPSHLSIVDATWDNRSWRQLAGCANLDTNMFFPTGLTGSSIEQTNLAKSVCKDCPVANQCLEFALRTLQDYGVWGGRTEEERRVIRRSRRAAARKAAVAASAALAASERDAQNRPWVIAGA